MTSPPVRTPKDPFGTESGTEFWDSEGFRRGLQRPFQGSEWPQFTTKKPLVTRCYRGLCAKCPL